MWYPVMGGDGLAEGAGVGMAVGAGDGATKHEARLQIASSTTPYTVSLDLEHVVEIGMVAIVLVPVQSELE